MQKGLANPSQTDIFEIFRIMFRIADGYIQARQKYNESSSSDTGAFSTGISRQIPYKEEIYECH